MPAHQRVAFVSRIGVAALLLAVTAACGSNGAASPSASASPGSSAAAPSAARSSPAASAAPSAAASASPAASGAIPTIPADKPVSITTATGVPSAVFTPVWIALDKGYFKEHGLNVTLEQIEGVTQAQAIIAGDVQIGNVGNAEVLDARVGGAQLIGIRQFTDSPVFEIHAAPSIKNIGDLKGKIIAITRTGSSTDLATRVILAKNHLTPGTDVKLLDANNMPGILAALESGQVAAGTMSPPTTVEADAAGFPKLVSAVDQHVPLPQNLMVTTTKYATDHPEVVYAYLEAELEGVRDFFNDPQLAVSTIAKYTKTDEKTAQEAYDATKPAMNQVGLVTSDGFKTVQQYGSNSKTRGLDVSQAYDDSFLKNLQASGYMQKLGLKS
jgi:ABC-type nitrate/sulfonate/bicarbonate transport system substrate-binding protein